METVDRCIENGLETAFRFGVWEQSGGRDVSTFEGNTQREFPSYHYHFTISWEHIRKYFLDTLFNFFTKDNKLFLEGVSNLQRPHSAYY